MDRFFSKLDLRDIKIKPEGNRFLPDEDEVETATPDQEPSYEPYDDQDDVTQQYEADGSDADDTESVFDLLEPSSPSTAYESAVASSNGHYPETPSYSSATAVHDEVAEADEVLKVSAKSRPSAVAGAIAGVVRECGHAEVQAIGAGATNQAIKAVAIARDYLQETGIDAICVPAFIDITIENEERTAIRLLVEVR